MRTAISKIAYYSKISNAVSPSFYSSSRDVSSGCSLKYLSTKRTLSPSLRDSQSLRLNIEEDIIPRRWFHCKASVLKECGKKLEIAKKKESSKVKENYTVRAMTKDDVPGALDVWRQTGMHEGTHCLYTWLEVDSEACSIAVTDSGKVIALCSAVVHHPDFAFFGLYSCLEKYRGHGVGKKVWDACIEHIGTRNAALNAVPDKMELYRERGGFPIVENRWTSVSNETKNTIHYEGLSDQMPVGVSIEPFQEAFLPVMSEYDLALVGYDRKLALELNCKEADSKTMVAFKDGKCVGFGTIKTSCQKFGMVGPLYADDAAVAEVMLRRLIVSLPKVEGFTMMTISSNSSASGFLKKIGCPAGVECPRLYRKKIMEVDTNKIFSQWDLGLSPY